MRPVNLIPQEDRPGGRRAPRSGPLAYVVVGALLVALLGVAALVAANNQSADLKDEIVQIEGEAAAAEAKATTLAPYTQFHAVAEQRNATIASLANSRFDWERVMRELGLVLPADVWLTGLTATASPAVSPEGAAAVTLRGSIPGPALALVGCARSQQAVAGFVQALKDIDGVTRVGVESSALGGESSAGSDSAGSGSTCQTRDFIAQFQMAVAFDAAPVATTTAQAPAEAVPSSSPESEGEAE
ncbi:MAG TPA: PilN domain-containing protein [Solirubrobacterales bacterium]